MLRAALLFGTATSVLSLLACVDGRPTLPSNPSPSGPIGSPGSPNPEAGPTGLLFGMVIDEFGGCIEGATVLILAGQNVGRTIVQQTPCDAWGYYGGFLLEDLTPGVGVTLRASAGGWTTQEKTFLPMSRAGYSAVFIELSKLGKSASSHQLGDGL